MTPPKGPQLFVIRVNGRVSFAIAARTERECEKYLLANSISIEKVNPTEAHMVGMNGVPVHYAHPSYQPEPGLFDPRVVQAEARDSLPFSDTAVAEAMSGQAHTGG